MIIFIVVCVSFFFMYIGIHIFGAIAGIIWAIIHEFVDSLEQLIRYITIDRKLEKTNIIEQKEEERRKRIQAEVEKENNRLYEYERSIAFGLIDKTNNLKFKYPYADTELFDKYKDSFYDYTFHELEDLENLIKQSHIINKTKKDNEKVQYTYNLSDIEKMKPLEVKKEYPITMALYRNNTDYIIYIRNDLANTHQLYQSKKYFVILDLCNNTLNTIYDLKEKKQSISALNIDNIIKDNHINDIHKIREQQIIDRINKGMRG